MHTVAHRRDNWTGAPNPALLLCQENCLRPKVLQLGEEQAVRLQCKLCLCALYSDAQLIPDCFKLAKTF